jgi:hypothetical protein
MKIRHQIGEEKERIAQCAVAKQKVKLNAQTAMYFKRDRLCYLDPKLRYNSSASLRHSRVQPKTCF